MTALTILRRAAAFIFLLLCWALASVLCGPTLVPGPGTTALKLLSLLSSQATWQHLATTLLRGLGGLALATIAAYLLGVPCGLDARLLDLVSPLVTAAQSCPPIVWISLVLVWASTGSTVPIIVVFASVFPVLFINIAQGTAHLDRRLFAMAKLHRVPRRRILGQLILPGIAQSSLAALTFALGITWKVTATAEFFGANTGIGAQIQRAFRLLDMAGLFAWTVIIIAIGLALELGMIHPLRNRAKLSD
jgi:ABC-type nitrate/sulfonate/bicarbonate transport system permease component